MKTTKLLATLLLFIAAAFNASASVKIGSLYYNLDSSTKTAEVTHPEYLSWDSEDYVSGGLVIPSTVKYGGTTYSVTSIGSEAFYWCMSLTSVTIPNSVTSIGDNAFENCSSLKSVTIPNSVTSIGDNAFENCSSLKSVTIPNSVTEIDNWAFAFCKSLKSVTIPNSVTSIGSYAFNRCTSLTSVTIGNSVTSIGDNAFEYCTSLTSAHITDLAAWCKIKFGSYSSNPFCYACKLYLNGTEVKYLVIPNSVTSIGDRAFSGCSGLTSVTIPNSVTSIGDDAFSGCSGLTSVTIPNSVTKIDDYTFAGCSGLTSVSIPNSVTSIGYKAFVNCTSLKSVTIPNSVTKIDDYAFRICTSLKSVTIGGNVSVIGNYAFYDCTNLSTVYSYAATPPQTKNSRVFSDETYQAATLYVPKGCVRGYKLDIDWSQFYNIVEGNYAGVDDIIADGAAAKIVGYYNLQGVRSAEPWDGMNIVVYGDGSRRKVMHE